MLTCEESKMRHSSLPRIVQSIKNLVEKEYMKDISLNYVADKVNLAPAYVSYIFKKETDQTVDCLNNRIQKILDVQPAYFLKGADAADKLSVLRPDQLHIL